MSELTDIKNRLLRTGKRVRVKKNAPTLQQCKGKKGYLTGGEWVSGLEIAVAGCAIILPEKYLIRINPKGG